MSVMSYGPKALKAYLMGRQAAQRMSVDPQTAAVPPDYAEEAEAYRQGLVDEQQHAPLPEQPGAVIPPAAPLPSPSAAPKPAPVSAAQQREEAYQRFLASLSKQPVQALHDIVVDQIVQIDKALAKSPYFSAALQPQHKLIKEELLKARGLLADGDRLVSLQDEESKQYRRAAYLDAYKISHGAGERLASASGEDWFLVSAAGKVVDSAKSAGKAALDSGEKVVTKVTDTYAAAGKEILKAGGAVAEKAGDQVAKVGGTLKTVLYIAAGGVAVSAIGYAVVRARQSASTRGR